MILPSGQTLTVREAQSEADFDQARTLMWGFLEWCQERYGPGAGGPDDYFEPEKYAEELGQLKIFYAPPEGTVLVAWLDEEPIGIVALRTISEGVCEMKRFYVLPECQGHGIGQTFAECLLDLARSRGFTTMRLETGGLQHEAAGLYRKLGFKDIATYSDVSPTMAENLLSMEIVLR